jgi:hypothetical protein
MSTIISTAPPATRAEALTRRGVFLIGVATLALLAVLAATAFRGPDRTGPLAWSGKTELFTHPTLPGDRILTGTLHNDGLHPLRVDIGDVRVLGSDGMAVPSSPVFLQTFGKTLWAAGRGPQTVPDTELQRTGRITMLRPGEEVPLTIAWHAKDGTPIRVDYGDGSLRIPG